MASGNGSGPRMVIHGNIPIIGQAKSKARLAEIKFIQFMVVGLCNCGGDIVIQNFTMSGKCSRCRSRYWVNAAQFDRSVDEMSFNVTVGVEAPEPEVPVEPDPESDNKVAG